MAAMPCFLRVMPLSLFIFTALRGALLVNGC